MVFLGSTFVEDWKVGGVKEYGPKPAFISSIIHFPHVISQHKYMSKQPEQNIVIVGLPAAAPLLHSHLNLRRDPFPH